ncbi:unnamed protein product [Somion occarium]|uniref:Uncharacterized protein n=1 Tax=Somion occarium TaxID=3059160 RepID=A0ABP1DXT9_9APHY
MQLPRISGLSGAEYHTKVLYCPYENLLRHIYTLFLFTRSDFKTLLIPVICFAMAALPDVQLYRVPQVVLWEDRVNKGYRPLPSRRLSLQNAIRLRWALVLVCWLFSLHFNVGTLLASIAVVALTITHNELGFHGKSWIIRNLLNGLGLASYEVGALLVISSKHAVDMVAFYAVLISAGLFATTIHAQDFQDIPGDRMIGRKTLPIVHPRLARFSLMILLPLWSILLAYTWRLGIIACYMTNVLSLYVGWRFLKLADVDSDQQSYVWYNVWLSLTNMLPGYYRYIQ